MKFSEFGGGGGGPGRYIDGQPIGGMPGGPGRLTPARKKERGEVGEVGEVKNAMRRPRQAWRCVSLLTMPVDALHEPGAILAQRLNTGAAVARFALRLGIPEDNKKGEVCASPS